LVFLSLGLLSIAAAITYTAGRRPYGYAGLGDVSVLIFFGFIGVGGSAYLFTLQFHEAMLWPALSCGLLATGVLNLNNLRDREADALAGKKTIPVRFGRRAGQFYHATLITGAMACAVVYVARQYVSAVQLLFLLTIPLFALNVRAVFVLEEARLDPWLRQLALSTLLFVLLFGAGQLLALP
jgi:1,4-dihydroxy-2-naphthoate octaprenyltransferase